MNTKTIRLFIEDVPKRAWSKFPSCISLNPRISASRKVEGSGTSLVVICLVIEPDSAERNDPETVFDRIGTVYAEDEESSDTPSRVDSENDVFILLNYCFW
jgi:hypothetical protein